MRSDLAALEQAVQTYLDGVYDADPVRLRQAFHPQAHLYSGTGGKLSDMPLEDWIALFTGRPSPRAAGMPRADRVLSIDLNGPAHAFVKLNCAVPRLYFTDYLTYAKADGRWQIIAKAYHFEGRDA